MSGTGEGMRRSAIVLIGWILVACSGDTAATTTVGVTTTTVAETTTTALAGFEVTSDDGVLTVRVPVEAMATDPGITATRLAADEIPEAFAALGPEAVVYSLAPDGLVFAAPVTISLQLDAAGLGATEVPVATLISVDHSGTGFLQGLTVTRSEEGVTVSGTTTHFSEVALATEQVLLEVRLLEVTDTFVTELGDPLNLGARFLSSEGATLTSPDLSIGEEIANATAALADGGVRIDCTALGSALGDLDFAAVLHALDTVETTSLVVAPRVSNVPVAGIDLTLRLRAVVTCNDPASVLTGGSVRLDLQVDHPGMAVFVPGEEFLGGLSAVTGTVSGPATSDLRVGLILDTNGDGVVDGADLIYPSHTTTPEGDSRRFVLPLFGLGRYFVYLQDGTLFSEEDTAATPEPVPVLTRIPLLAALFRGPGRVESAIGVVGANGSATVIVVGVGETAHEVDGSLLIFVTPRVLQAD